MDGDLQWSAQPTCLVGRGFCARHRLGIRTGRPALFRKSAQAVAPSLRRDGVHGYRRDSGHRQACNEVGASFLQRVTFQLDLEGRSGFGYSRLRKNISYQEEQRKNC